MFGLVIPNKISKITRVSENFELVTQPKQFSDFKIIQVHNPNSFWGFGVTPTTQAEFLEN